MDLMAKKSPARKSSVSKRSRSSIAKLEKLAQGVALKELSQSLKEKRTVKIFLSGSDSVEIKTLPQLKKVLEEQKIVKRSLTSFSISKKLKR